ncbi:uncharacterized protein Dana_GF26343 [Drosophila ananassae]|uniref:Uncharacterized protein n=1 Tax=Drosophila ananassae TaxID=7217 RepID=A0A0P8XV94_DROAN|nr:uncharacterized protein LOC26513752 [Drosophila ananassae]KPU78648.1 uncharacterized protein Dana_GF26343 [Drosophila ananassae]
MYRNLSFVLPVIGNRLRTAFNISGLVQKVTKSPLVDLPIFSTPVGRKTALDPPSQVSMPKNPTKIKTSSKPMVIGKSPGVMTIFEAMGNHLTGCNYAKQYG